jgi:hypothetical protein
MKQIHSVITLSAPFMLWLHIAHNPSKSSKRNTLIGHIGFRKQQTYFITQPCNYRLR